MAGGSMRSALVTLFIFAIVLSPISTPEAARFVFLDTTPICPACVCCAPPPQGSCCDCCATPIETQSQEGSP
ncbi:hypothetical protein C1H46_012840 [Malus baccata]|uniref:Bowman-Birk serine protease inhibitors family domain-containing protein n=1 Tax=Malus baccata TaxID=106549 RepID=A0A540MTB5_MALBA|nr:hypothetical protein C1H46_012840 [Malus baccata]